MGQKKITELDTLSTVSNSDVLVVDTGSQTYQTTKAVLVTGKQDTLVSGTNIKTVNGQSLLGPGNVPFPSIPTIPVTDVKVNDESVVEDTVAEIEVPTKTSELTNDSGYITGITSSMVTTALGYTPYNATNPVGYDVGTITGINMNGASKGTSGIVDLGTVITSVADKQDTLVDSGTGQNVKTINGQSFLGTGDLDIVSVSSTGTATDEVNYITVDGTEYKLAGGGGSGTITDVRVDGTSVVTGTVANINNKQDKLSSSNAGNCISIEAKQLPSGYTEYDYLESYGEQYIDTGLTQADVGSIELKGYTTDTGTQFFCGASITTTFVFQLAQRMADDKMIADIGAVDSSSSTRHRIISTVSAINSVHTYKIDRTTGNLYIDGSLIGTSGTSLSSPGSLNIYLFTTNYSTAGAQTDASVVIYYCKMYNTSGTLIRNFIPAKRNSDDAIGMYDLVTSTFYENQGESDFEVGTEISETTIINALISANESTTGSESYITSIRINNILYRFPTIATGSITVTSTAGSTITCGDYSYTLGSSETTHTFNDMIWGGYIVSAAKSGLNTRSKSLTLSSSSASITVRPTNVPSGYTQYDYMASSGSQYINTLFSPNNNTRVVCDIMVTNATSSSSPLAPFGGRNSATDSTFNMWVTSSLYGPQYNGNDWTSNQVSYTIQNNRLTMDFNKNVVTVGSTSTTFTAGTFQSDYTMFIYGLNNGGSLDSRAAAMRLYNFKLYDNGTLIRDYYPAKNESTNAYGLYDIVNSRFYTNSGSGTFTPGTEM